MCGPLLTLVILFAKISFLLSEPIVQLSDGQIMGRQSSTSENVTVYAFEGIPYAAPPIGPLRFKAPQPPQKWENVLNTTQMQNVCIQMIRKLFPESEDCLYINVFTPQLPDGNDTTPIPVIFYIYGGGFADGSSPEFQSDLFANNGVILVTFNYRVGIFGFLSTQDEVVPGNYGLKDQQLALEWTNNNIHAFGGDPNKITIMGQSAGAASVCYQLLNQKSTGLFQGAILMSGSCLCPWSYQRNAREIAFATASSINSSLGNSSDSKALLEFLQSVDVNTLNTAAFIYKTLNNGVDNMEIVQGFIWAPVIEPKSVDAFLTKKMYGLLKAGNFIRVPTLIGITSEESILFNLDIFKYTATFYEQHLDWLVPNDMQIANQSDRIDMGQAIKELYTGGAPFSEHLGDAIRYSSDTSFTRPIIKHAELASKFVDVYFYVFSFDGRIAPFHVNYTGAESVAHGGDLAYLTCSGSGCDDRQYPESDRVTRARVVKLWTDFAKFQNPTPAPSELLQNTTWLVVSEASESFYFLDIGENLEIGNQPKNGTYQGWKTLYDELHFDDFDTY